MNENTARQIVDGLTLGTSIMDNSTSCIHAVVSPSFFYRDISQSGYAYSKQSPKHKSADQKRRNINIVYILQNLHMMKGCERSCNMFFLITCSNIKL